MRERKVIEDNFWEFDAIRVEPLTNVRVVDREAAIENQRLMIEVLLDIRDMMERRSGIKVNVAPAKKIPARVLKKVGRSMMGVGPDGEAPER